MHHSIVLLALVAALATAQNTTLPVFIMGDEQPLVASVVSANPSTTSLAVNCPVDEDATECGFGPGINVEIISKTIYQASMTESDAFSMSISCDYASAKTEMMCVMSMGGQEANDPGVSTGTFTGSEVSFNTVTVTAGAQKLAAATGAAEQTGESAKASGASATGSAGAPQSTGAAGRFGVEGSALLALVGAAAINIL